ncbi:MAG: HIT family protein [Burkholderiaceae bacterium]
MAGANPGPTSGSATDASECPLCRDAGGDLVYQNDELRIVLADEPDYPGFTRVVWNDHQAEMTDLSPSQQQKVMQVVFQVESVMRQVMKPDKINLASLGNQVPHLHWHIIARYQDDPTFPAPVWANPVRTADPARLRDQRTQYRVALTGLG